MPLVAQVKSAKVRRRGSNMSRVDDYNRFRLQQIKNTAEPSGSGSGSRVSVGRVGDGTYGPRLDINDRMRIGAGVGTGAIGGRGKVAGVNARFAFKDGGSVKEGKCDPQIAAFKNMIKSEAKPVKKACGGAAKVRKGMMKGK